MSMTSFVLQRGLERLHDLDAEIKGARAAGHSSAQEHLDGGVQTDRRHHPRCTIAEEPSLQFWLAAQKIATLHAGRHPHACQTWKACQELCGIPVNPWPCGEPWQVQTDHS